MPPQDTSTQKWDLIEHIEKQMDTVSQSYFKTATNLIKWNTALAVAAILWFGNFIINTPKSLDMILQITAYGSLWALVIAVAISIGLFYSVSRYFNNYWVLCSEWRESVCGRIWSKRPCNWSTYWTLSKPTKNSKKVWSIFICTNFSTGSRFRAVCRIYYCVQICVLTVSLSLKVRFKNYIRCRETARRQTLSKSIAHVIGQLRCYSVVRPIMRASHARDRGSNPLSSTLFLLMM